jgi:DNA-binding NarL/FixJ family response regulator
MTTGFASRNGDNFRGGWVEPMTKQRIRVGIVEDHPLFRRGLIELLAEIGTVDVVWAASTVDEMRSILLSGGERPDLILLDRSLPAGGPQNTQAVAVVVQDGFRVLVVSRTDAGSAVANAMAAGASGYVSKNAAEVEMITAIEAVMQGEKYVGRSLSSSDNWATRANLAPRELQVVRLLAHGYSDAAIASAMLISVQTVRTHLDRIENKIGIRKRGKIVRWAIENGVISPDEDDDWAP